MGMDIKNFEDLSELDSLNGLVISEGIFSTSERLNYLLKSNSEVWGKAESSAKTTLSLIGYLVAIVTICSKFSTDINMPYLIVGAVIASAALLISLIFSNLAFFPRSIGCIGTSPDYWLNSKYLKSFDSSTDAYRLNILKANLLLTINEAIDITDSALVKASRRLMVAISLQTLGVLGFLVFFLLGLFCQVNY